MYELFAELGTELIAIAVYVVTTVALSALAVVVEYNGVQQLLGGDPLLAAWYAYVGVVVLAFAATVGRQKLLPLVAARR